MGRTQTEPYCIIGKISWGVAQAIKVPESRAHLYTTKAHGWKVLIRDSEMPTIWPATPKIDRMLSGTNRRMWLNESDVRDEFRDEDATDEDNHE